ncbi:MAG: hypothetical protein AABW92_01655 [Nanoarchaeota archaeon]
MLDFKLLNQCAAEFNNITEIEAKTILEQIDGTKREKETLNSFHKGYFNLSCLLDSKEINYSYI